MACGASQLYDQVSCRPVDFTHSMTQPFHEILSPRGSRDPLRLAEGGTPPSEGVRHLWNQVCRGGQKRGNGRGRSPREARRMACGKELIFMEFMTTSRKLRRPDRARNERPARPERLDDTRCTTYKRCGATQRLRWIATFEVHRNFFGG